MHCLGSLRLVSEATQKAPSRSWVNTLSIPSSVVQASNRYKQRKMIWNYSSDCPRSGSLWLQRHDPQHLHPLIQVAMWVGGLRGPLEESVLCLSVCLCLSCRMPVWACSPSVSEGIGTLSPEIWATRSASYLSSAKTNSAHGKLWLKYSLDSHSVIVPCVSRHNDCWVRVWAVLHTPSFTAKKHDKEVEWRPTL